MGNAEAPRQRGMSCAIVIVAALCLLIGCTAWRHGQTRSVEDQLLLAKTGPGAERLTLECAYDHTIKHWVRQHGSPDYILVEGIYDVKLAYIDTDRIVHFDRPWYSSNSEWTVHKGIPEAISDGFVAADAERLERVRSPGAPRPKTVAKKAASTSPAKSASTAAVPEKSAQRPEPKTEPRPVPRPDGKPKSEPERKPTPKERPKPKPPPPEQPPPGEEIATVRLVMEKSSEESTTYYTYSPYNPMQRTGQVTVPRFVYHPEGHIRPQLVKAKVRVVTEDSKEAADATLTVTYREENKEPSLGAPKRFYFSYVLLHGKKGEILSKPPGKYEELDLLKNAPPFRDIGSLVSEALLGAKGAE